MVYALELGGMPPIWTTSVYFSRPIVMAGLVYRDLQGAPWALGRERMRGGSTCAEYIAIRMTGGMHALIQPWKLGLGLRNAPHVWCGDVAAKPPRDTRFSQRPVGCTSVSPKVCLGDGDHNSIYLGVHYVMTRFRCEWVGAFLARW